MMQTREYTVRFNTPAFLGNAEQSGQWRTPPFKALLRQWWRVAYAAGQGFNINITEMREAEGKLFGNAWLENDFRKSQVLMRLSCWDEGKLKQWQENGQESNVHHKEVQNNNGNISANLYLGYGPLKVGPHLKFNAAIQAGETARLSIAVPDDQAERVWQALWLMNRYGTIGGRSRNGWGSFSLQAGEGPDFQPPKILRVWQDALNRDWPHAIGCSQKDQILQPLIWQTKEHEKWNSLMQELAHIKIGLRTQFKFTTGTNALRTEDRHWISYPVTKHSVHAWGNNLRLPNSLRFKIRTTENNQLVGIIFHVPCKPPLEFRPNIGQITTVWQQVHAFLDNPAQNLTRIME